MNKIKAVIFDLDDTLISERDYIASGYEHIATILAQEFNKNKDDINLLLNKLFQESPKNVFNRLYDQLEIPYEKKDILRLVHEYRNHFPRVTFFDDVLPCLDNLKENNIKTGIITDGYAYAQRQKLKAVNAAQYFHEIIVTDELGDDAVFWKPHPKAFEVMRERLDVEFDEMAYIGDNPEKDFFISSVHPIKTIRIHRDGVHAKKKYLEDIRENQTIHSLTEIKIDQRD